MAAMLFGWRVVKHVKSNAIVYASVDRTLGIGAGQMSRVDASRIAVWKATEAGLSLKGSAVASDAFFPFPDGLIAAADAGATCAIQPGGSVRDAEVIAAADERRSGNDLHRRQAFPALELFYKPSHPERNEGPHRLSSAPAHHRCLDHDAENDERDKKCLRQSVAIGSHFGSRCAPSTDDRIINAQSNRTSRRTAPKIPPIKKVIP